MCGDGPTCGQSVRLNPAATVRVTATNNAGLGPGPERSRMSFRRRPNARALDYRGQPLPWREALDWKQVPTRATSSRDLPSRAWRCFNPIERLLFLDASVDATTTKGSIRCAYRCRRAVRAAGHHSVCDSRQPVHPGEPPADTGFVARSDNEWVRRRNGSRTTSLSDQDARFQSVVRLAHDPVPMGFVVGLPDGPAILTVPMPACAGRRIGVNYLLDARSCLLGLIARARAQRVLLHRQSRTRSAE